jgi:hypothetical protein
MAETKPPGDERQRIRTVLAHLTRASSRSQTTALFAINETARRL